MWDPLTGQVVSVVLLMWDPPLGQVVSVVVVNVGPSWTSCVSGGC